MHTRLRYSVYRGIQTLFKSAGLWIGFDHPVRNAPKLFAVKAAELGVNCVLDAGANRGQFAREVRECGYTGTIVSFEPQSSVHAELADASAGDANWYVAPRMALGDMEGAAEINISENLASSSLLPVMERSVSAAAGSAFAAKETDPVHRLDDVIEAAWKPPFGLKLDTQGFEIRVLEGGLETLAQTKLVLSEMSLSELYEGGASFVDVYRFLQAQGFRCISLVHGFADNTRHELLQVDGVFVREP